jgi:hypothetical protein
VDFHGVQGGDIHGVGGGHGKQAALARHGHHAVTLGQLGGQQRLQVHVVGIFLGAVGIDAELTADQIDDLGFLENGPVDQIFPKAHAAAALLGQDARQFLLTQQSGLHQHLAQFLLPCRLHIRLVSVVPA